MAAKIWNNCRTRKGAGPFLFPTLQCGTATFLRNVVADKALQVSVLCKSTARFNLPINKELTAIQAHSRHAFPGAAWHIRLREVLREGSSSRAGLEGAFLSEARAQCLSRRCAGLFLPTAYAECICRRCTGSFCPRRVPNYDKVVVLWRGTVFALTCGKKRKVWERIELFAGRPCVWPISAGFPAAAGRQAPSSRMRRGLP